MRPPTTGPAGPRSRLPATGLFLVVFLAYAAGAVVSAIAFGGSELGPTFYPPAGVSAAALLISPRRRWPVIIAAVVLAEISVDLFAGLAPQAIVGYVLANSLEPVIGAALVLAGCRRTPDLRRRRDLVIFVVGSCLAGPLLGGLIVASGPVCSAGRTIPAGTEGGGAGGGGASRMLSMMLLMIAETIGFINVDYRPKRP